MPDDVILQWGSPALYEPALEVRSFDDILRAQARRLCRRLIEADGAGLAATQVGSLRRMFAFRIGQEDEPQVLVNPRIEWRSPTTEIFYEGCLSFNSVVVAVERPAAVCVSAYDPHGRVVELEGHGFAASLLQHEIDHLDGILTLHRAERSERRRAISELLAPPSAASVRAA